MNEKLLPNGRALELLYEAPELPESRLHDELLATYGGGGLGFGRAALIANFVSSIDGVVALPGNAESGQIVSQASVADRFVMGVLRALSDAVIVGAGTFRRSPTHLWQAGTIYPSGASEFAELRRRLGLAPQPRFVLVSASGRIDTSGPALDGAWVVTTHAAEASLRTRLRGSCRVLAYADSTVPVSDVIAELRSDGMDLLLTEGGPSLFAELISRGLVDELFLTRAPTLFGRYVSDERKALTEGFDLGGVSSRLLSVRRHASHLFLRYALNKPTETAR